MIQKISCLECGERQMAMPDDLDPDWNSSWLEGTLKPRGVAGDFVIKTFDDEELYREKVPPSLYVCDSCGKDLHVGERAVAWTMWRAGTPRMHWEVDMLVDTKLLKEVRREPRVRLVKR